MGATCSRAEVELPAPPARDLEGWARLGVPATLRAHEWLSRLLVLQEGRDRRRRAKDKAAAAAAAATAAAGGAGASRRGSAKGRGGGGGGGDEDEDALSSLPVIRTRFEVRSWGDGGGGGLDVFETPQTLAAVREDLRAAVGAAAAASRGPTNLLRNDLFLRAAGWLVLNRSVVIGAASSSSSSSSSSSLPPLPTFTGRVSAHDCHTLEPELRPAKIAALLARAKKLAANGRKLGANSTALPGSWAAAGGVVTEVGLERWMGKEEKDSLGESVFFPFFFRVVRASTGPRQYTAPEFVQAVDRFCTFNEEELLRFAFLCLARVGTRPREYPLLAISSLPREFSELRQAAGQRGHTSRPLLDELKKRAASLSKTMDERVRVLKTASCVLLDERGEGGWEGGDEPDDGDGEEDEDEEGEGDGEAAAARRRARRARSAPAGITTGPEDLLTVGEWLDMARRSPLSVFDLVYLQLHMRRKTFGEAFWLARQKEVRAYWARGQQLVLEAEAAAAAAAADEEEEAAAQGEGEEEEEGGGEAKAGAEGGASTVDKPSAAAARARVRARSRAHIYGYAAARCRPLPDPFSLPALPQLLAVEPATVPTAVRFALAVESMTYPPPDELADPPPAVEGAGGGRGRIVGEDRAAPPLVAEEDGEDGGEEDGEGEGAADDEDDEGQVAGEAPPAERDGLRRAPSMRSERSERTASAGSAREATGSRPGSAAANAQAQAISASSRRVVWGAEGGGQRDASAPSSRRGSAADNIGAGVGSRSRRKSSLAGEGARDGGEGPAAPKVYGGRRKKKQAQAEEPDPLGADEEAAAAHWRRAH
jgi:hypothetical protein